MEVHILPLFTEIEKNNCWSDLNILQKETFTVDLIDISKREFAPDVSFCLGHLLFWIMLNSSNSEPTRLLDWRIKGNWLSNYNR